MYAQMYICTYVCLYVRMYVCTYVHCMYVCMYVINDFVLQEPVFVGGQHLGRRLLAAPHPAQAGDPPPQRGQVRDAGGQQGEAMCLLEEVPPSTG